MAGLENPFPIQSSDSRSGISLRRNVPLVLIHDGGGTIVSYTDLGPLGRKVWGIHNPRFYAGGYFEGGLHEMAKLYTDMIVKIVPTGPFLLGGWSLGGLLSQTIAHNIASDPSSQRSVLGIVMVDSPCPLSWSRPSSRPVAVGAPSFSKATGAETRKRVTDCMTNAGRMATNWTLPEWKQGASSQVKPPPQVLIRCKEYAPTPEGAAEDAVARVDLGREESDLGWGEYWRLHGIEAALVETEGHHYNVFAPKHIQSATNAIADSINMILEGSVTSAPVERDGAQIQV